MAVRWLYIRTVVVWGASLGGLDSIRRRADIEALVQFDRLIGSFVAFAGRSFEQWSSSSGDRRLVLPTVVWFWRRSSGCHSGASLGREDVRKEERVRNQVAT